MRLWLVIRYKLAPGMLLGQFPMVYPYGRASEQDLKVWADGIAKEWCQVHHYNSAHLGWSLYSHVSDGDINA